MGKLTSVAKTARQHERIGKYRLQSELDFGSPGTVYLAEEPSTHQAVVIRLLPGRASNRESFLDEVRRLRRLEHPHIATIMDAGEANDEHFLVMEHLKGESLQDRLKREHRLPLKEALRIAREIASALALVHSHEVVHRQLCPANVWLEPSGRMRLLGLGSSLGGSQHVLLTRFEDAAEPGYLSPEQAAGEELTSSSDLFSLGCLLYHMTTGERPFRGESSPALFRAVVFDHPSTPRQINPGIPEAIDDLINRLLAKLPTHRPASVDEVERWLTDWLDPVTARQAARPQETPYPASRRILETIESLKPPLAEETRPGPAASPERVKPRHGWWLDAIAAALLIAGALGLYLWWRASQETPAAEPAATRELKP